VVKKSDWNGEQGSSDMGSEFLRKDRSGLGYKKPVDISKIVDQASKIDDGFAGKLPKND
jgi:hypothetical protein